MGGRSTWALKHFLKRDQRAYSNRTASCKHLDRDHVDSSFSYFCFDRGMISQDAGQTTNKFRLLYFDYCIPESVRSRKVV